MSWFLDKAAKGTMGTGKFAYDKLFGGSPLAAGFGLLTTAYYAGEYQRTYDEADSKMLHGAKYAAALGLDLGVDALVNGIASKLPGPYGVGLQIASNLVAPGFLAAFNHMDSEYSRLKKQGRHYEMSENSAQMLQRQLSNLQGAGSNLAEMMHN
jgi:hypothetical protein